MKKRFFLFSATKFISQEAYGGLALIAAAIIAVIWANSAYHESYHHLWHEVKFSIALGDFDLTASLHHWINDGLMAFFFFTIGLEIKREIMDGELSTLKKAALPITAAFGGMIFPAIFYVLMVRLNPEFINGWGIPMATDIAFALGLMALLGNRVSLNLKIFLSALAIADDLGAVLVIAIFYTDTIDYMELFYAAISLTMLIGANLAGVRNMLFYAIVGILGVWIAFIFSGVHATIAGVLIAFTIPARSRISKKEYEEKFAGYLEQLRNFSTDTSQLLSKEYAHLLSSLEKLNKLAHTPLQRIEHKMLPVTAYFILPLFALSNAGVHIEGSFFDTLLHPIALAIIIGLVAGKFLGISLFTRLMVKLKVSSLPDGVTWRQLYGMAMLAGIGFTMSIFISDLAFVDTAFKQIAKVGIVCASIVSAMIGMAILSKGDKQPA